MRKAFKSSVVFDQQVVSRDTMPTAMLETYKNCDKPPPLDILNPYRYVIIKVANIILFGLNDMLFLIYFCLLVVKLKLEYSY